VKKWVALPLLLLLLTAGCERRGRGTGEEAAAGPPATAEAHTAAEASGDAGQRARSRETAGSRAPEAGEVVPSREITLQREPESRPEKPGGAAAQLLPLESPTRLPEDVRIGPLTDLLTPAGAAERQIVRVANRVLEGLSAGKVIEQALLPDVRDDLGRSLQYSIDQGLIPRNFRLGAIYFEEDTAAYATEGGPARPAGTAWLNVRLFGDPGAAEGELYLSSSGGEWYVSDLQVAFPLLAEPYERSGEKYIPSVYGWRLQ
jgi:hypothetical protein